MSSDSILALRPLAAVDVSASIVSAGEIARMVPKTWSHGKVQEGKKMGDERSDRGCCARDRILPLRAFRQFFVSFSFYNSFHPCALRFGSSPAMTTAVNVSARVSVSDLSGSSFLRAAPVDDSVVLPGFAPPVSGAGAETPRSFQTIID